MITLFEYGPYIIIDLGAPVSATAPEDYGRIEAMRDAAENVLCFCEARAHDILESEEGDRIEDAGNN